MSIVIGLIGIVLIYHFVNLLIYIERIPLGETIKFTNTQNYKDNNYVPLDCKTNIDNIYGNKYWRKTAQIYHLFLKSNFDISRRDILEYINDKIKKKAINNKRIDVFNSIQNNYNYKPVSKIKKEKTIKEEIYNNTIMQVMSKNPTLSLVLKDDKPKLDSGKTLPVQNLTISQKLVKIQEELKKNDIQKKYNMGDLRIDEIDSEQYIKENDINSPSSKKIFFKEKSVEKKPILTDTDLNMIQSYYPHDFNENEENIIILKNDSINQNKMLDDFKFRLGDISPINPNRSLDSIDISTISKTLFGGRSRQKKHLTQIYLQSKKLSTADVLSSPVKINRKTRIQERLPQGILDDISEIDSSND